MVKMIKYIGLATSVLLLIIVSISTFAQTPSRGESSYSPVVIKESFEDDHDPDEGRKARGDETSDGFAQ